MSGWSAAASAGTGLAGPIIGGLFNREGQHLANEANAAAASRHMAFQSDQSSTQWQRGVHDMRQAGLNPALAYGQGPASAAHGASYQSENVNAGLADGINKGVANAFEAKRLSQDLAMQNSNIKLNLSTAALQAANAAKADVDAELLRQLLPEKQAEGKLWRELGDSGPVGKGLILLKNILK